MAYSKTNNTPNKDISYLNKDYSQLKQNLVEFTKTYFPDNFNDFSESNPGMIFLEMASYVGDVLSFYIDTQIQETFIQSAQEKTNLLALAYNLGYKPSVTNASTTEVDLFMEVPAKGTSPYAPDFDYALTINKNSNFKTTGGESAITFTLENDVNFSISSSLSPLETIIHQTDGADNPEYYLLKKKGKVISGTPKTKTFEIGPSQRFLTLELSDKNIIKIESIIDSDGNSYLEVPYLAQETIFEEISNDTSNTPGLSQYSSDTPYLLKLKKVPKRFVARFLANNTLQIQFGAGITSNTDEDIIPNPDNIGLGVKDGRSLLDLAFDPSNFLFTKTYGETPKNTTLTVTYIVGGGVKSNVDSNTITRKNTVLTSDNIGGLDSGVKTTVINSIAVNNPQAATGGGPGDSIEDIRLNSISNASSQLRTVSKEDYIIRTLNLPPQLGRVAKAYIIKDDQISASTSSRISNPNSLNLYTLGYNSQNQLTPLNPATRQNLITYLEQYRMLTDSINIKNGFIINFAIEFDIVVFKNFNNQEVLLNSINSLKKYFDIQNWQFNQPILISEIFNVLGQVTGVQNVEDIRFKNKAGNALGYSKHSYDFGSATINNIIYPSQDIGIFELKYPNSDIKGRVVKY